MDGYSDQPGENLSADDRYTDTWPNYISRVLSAENIKHGVVKISIPFIVFIAIVIVLLVILIALVVASYTIFKKYMGENFQSREEKASFITNWAQNKPKISYNDFKSQVPDSDIIDYDKIKKSTTGGKLNEGKLVENLM